MLSDIERIRFEDRLSVNMDIEPQTLDARLPNLILQPIVENAIRHGISSRTSAGRIGIEARRLNGTLQVQVTANGPGLGTESNSGSIVKAAWGCQNTQARLKQLYGDITSSRPRKRSGRRPYRDSRDPLHIK
jgi:LytS/YehU family sensor histidine kinase